ncbi:MAG TPA: SDR family NAD(P)-dependent oxidoreductase [Candidatus Paceibacterota bacterium]|jgi:NAD(P)-dependent dehydrogenase (short-subunit alcohol dehydrogenase family)
MKTALITGASRGIGRALAKKFLNEGYFVIGTSTGGKLSYENENLASVQLDLASPGSIKECSNEITALGKKIDILINNAGIWAGDESEEESPNEVRIDWLRQTLEVNLIGTIDFTQRVLPLISESGHIVNVSSRAGSLGHAHHANYPDYKISKAALNMFTRVLSFQLEGKGIIVSSVHPGWVRTDMGGDDADLSPEEAAEPIFKLATSDVETGQFWFNGEKFQW